MITRTIILQADLLCETGLHIGNKEGGNAPRGLNAPVLQNPVLQINGNFAPYIAATSIKGKLRNIAEILFDKNLNLKFVDEVDPTTQKLRVLRRHECQGIEAAKQCPVCFLFGSSTGAPTTPVEKSENFQGRLLFRNAPLKNTVPAERKTENALQRLRREANPRQNERVPRLALFDFEIVYLVHKNENSPKIINGHLSDLVACLRFLETNYLGGSGTRGYGKIKLTNLRYDGKPQPTLEHMQRSLLSKEVAA